MIENEAEFKIIQKKRKLLNCIKEWFWDTYYDRITYWEYIEGEIEGRK